MTSRARLAPALGVALAIGGCPDTERPVIDALTVRTCTTEELSAFQDASDAEERTDLLIAFIDVGHGDAIWIRTPGQENNDAREILLDAGDDGASFGGATFPDGTKAVRDFMHFMRFLPEDPSNPIDYLVVTNADKDHYGGMRALIDTHGFHVGTFVDPGYPETQTTYQALLDAVAARPEISVLRPLLGPGLEEGAFGRDVDVEVLSADADAAEVNNSSIVLALTYRGVRVLLTGDAEAPLESRLLNEGRDVRADVLKVAHHGSMTSSTPEFLERVFPGGRKGRRYAIISAGEREPLPHPDALDRLLEKVGEGGLYRTDRDDDGKSMRDAAGDDHVLLRVDDEGNLSVCYAFADARSTIR